MRNLGLPLGEMVLARVLGDLGLLMQPRDTDFEDQNDSGEPVSIFFILVKEIADLALQLVPYQKRLPPPLSQAMP
jgi:hypothetical protein